ncbi:MFS general substrate transporter-like protein [Hypoxylon crocopeplum]|nr:MFS general substrate transporter-like protein [Hypoxylon crocopeplum]
MEDTSRKSEDVSTNPMDRDDAAVVAESKEADPPSFTKGFRFYAVLAAVGFAGLLTALEATITSTALPSIVADLGGGDTYIWAVNGYFLSMTALQPLFGQLANVFGRRWPMIIATAIFVLGCGLCGGASNMAMLIAGRVIQGAGAGGVNVLIEIIICDLVPMPRRGNYLAVLFGLIALGTALGPFFGGLIVDHTTWRWVFYLNLPVGGFALVVIVLYLHVNYRKEQTLADKLTKIDWVGNLIFIGSISSILIALSWAGSVYPWSSYHIIVPLVMGLVGLVLFMLFESTPRLAPQPMMPPHILSNRTSATALVLTFLHSIVTMWTLYFLPIFFQGVQLSSPTRSGVQLLPTILILVPFAALGGGLMTKTGRYRPFHHIAFALMTIGFGLFSLLDQNSNTGSWVGFQILESAGQGLVLPTVLPAVLASLAESDVALATSTWAFLRSFGMTWGSAIPGAIFNNRFDQLAPGRITNQAVLSQVTGGNAYGHATAAFVSSLDPETQQQFISVLTQALQLAWQVAIAFAGFGFLLVILEKEVPLRQSLETEFGIEEKKSRSSLVEEGVRDSGSSPKLS